MDLVNRFGSKWVFGLVTMTCALFASTAFAWTTGELEELGAAFGTAMSSDYRVTEGDWLYKVDCQGEQCLGNNPDTIYGSVRIPYRIGRYLGRSRAFKLRATDAIVLLLETPPESRYYGFTVYLKDRYYESRGKRVETAMSLADTLNHSVIQTASGSLFSDLAAIVLTADKLVAEDTVNQLMAIGFPEHAVNFIVMPNDEVPLEMGTESEADNFSLMCRISYPINGEQVEDYLERSPVSVFHVRPLNSREVVRLPPPPFRDPHTGIVEPDELRVAMEEKIAEIVEQYSDEFDIEEQTFIAKESQPFRCAELGISCYADNSDGLYLGNIGNYIPKTQDDKIIIVGVNHVELGMATYFSHSVLRATGNIGVIAISDEWISTIQDPDTGVYTVTTSYNCGDDPTCLTIPDNEEGIPFGEPLHSQGRVYLNLVSQTRPSQDEVIFQRVLILTKRISSEMMPKDFEPPGLTTWKPEGCRAVAPENPILPTGEGWRNIHSDIVNSDEEPTALAPVFSPGWIAETNHYYPAGPVFDAARNIYGAPMWPNEDITMVALDPETGERRWAIPNITGAPPGGTSPMVLNDPDNPGEQIIYQGLYDRALAVRPDGSMVWDIDTGLTLSGTYSDVVMGTNYVPTADAIVAAAADGYVYAVDRATGAMLTEAYKLPGSPSPADPSPPSPAIVTVGSIVIGQYIHIPEGSTYQDYVDLIRGNETVVANQLAVDPTTGRIWIAATAPDENDGKVDGISELGAIYGIDLVETVDGYEFVEACSRQFDGSTTSTPSMSSDGSRLYVSDRRDTLIAINHDCSDAWTLPMGNVITGSISISSEKNEIYAASPGGVFKVIDEDSQGRVEWEANINIYDVPPEMQEAGFDDFNMNLASIGANALFFQVGAGYLDILPFKVGMGQLDRETGAVRWFAEGLEEVGVMTIGPDGSLYVGHSPLRRFRAMYLSKTEPESFPPSANLVGGIRKWPAERLDLLFRDATCSAADRVANSVTVQGICPESASADIRQAKILIEQSKDAGMSAVERGDMPLSTWDAISPELIGAEQIIDTNPSAAADTLANACNALL